MSAGGPVVRRRVRLRGARLVIVIAGVAALSLAAGLVLSRFVVSPAELQASAKAPVAGPITAPIEKRVVRNTLTLRADVTHADAVDLKVDTTGLGGPAVVTGHVPEVGATLEAGSVALEVAGRPVIVMPGDLPAYRTLRSGMSGPDVTELKTALAALGIDPGDRGSDRYDAAAAAGVAELYRRAGYPAPSVPDAQQQLDAARQAERAAAAGVDQAQSALATASNPASGAALLEADNGVRQAQRERDGAAAEGAAPAELDRLDDALALARALRAELDRAPDTTAEIAALDSARDQLDDAREQLGRAEEQAMTPVPAGEIAYLSSLPRRVDEVKTERGAILQGAALQVSGAELVLQASIDQRTADALKPGMTAEFTAADGTAFTATVRSIDARSAAAAGQTGKDGADAKTYDLVLVPQPLSSEQAESLRGTNVRVGVPIQATEGEVLAVPVAALTAGADGASRIELLADGEATSRLITVTTGLSAGGFVEIRSDDPEVVAGARVVVGR
ncbi:hypothetical protein N1031_16215 [Herbiconiux moechotypicola]|uniref:Peptidoglycan-binding protein n=1 Tax=Herbiconiux moechotypicola TaxID=637393 RepID=A0ABP5QXX7_9MICO|nr:hypothetical protein [Herbiconiux moechotypicola]MCS5731310.1 hypothetical protein [Herbiconiux moechotypicola]